MGEAEQAKADGLEACKCRGNIWAETEGNNRSADNAANRNKTIHGLLNFEGSRSHDSSQLQKFSSYFSLEFLVFLLLNLHC
jgi:hypothetical protein